jgi:hypothetical protein
MLELVFVGARQFLELLEGGCISEVRAVANSGIALAWSATLRNPSSPSPAGPKIEAWNGQHAGVPVSRSSRAVELLPPNFEFPETSPAPIFPAKRVRYGSVEDPAVKVSRVQKQ